LGGLTLMGVPVLVWIGGNEVEPYISYFSLDFFTHRPLFPVGLVVINHKHQRRSMLVGLIVGWIISSVIVAALAQDREIGYETAFLISLVLSPLIGAIFVATSPKKKEDPRKVLTPKAKELIESARAKYLSRDYTGAMQDYQELLNVKLASPSSNFMLACIFSLQRKQDEAFYHLGKAVVQGFNELEIIRSSPDLAFLRSQFVATSPKEGVYHRKVLTPGVKELVESARAKYLARDYTGAMQDYQEVLTIQPLAPNSHFMLSCIFSLQRKQDEAFSHLGKAVVQGFTDLKSIRSSPDLAFLRSRDDTHQLAQEPNKPSPQPGEENSVLLGLERLAALREKGLLTEDEFQVLKKKLLNN
jgi:hypothetical protein